MTDTLAKLFEHNNWANDKLINVCLGLADEQLDAAPKSVTMGTIRETMIHLVGAQHGYLSLLTLPVEERTRLSPQKEDWLEIAKRSGEGLLPLARGEKQPFDKILQTRDGYHVDPWVVMVQVINHAHEHREQICSMLNALGIATPEMDGWAYGDAAKALVPITK
jgi:uncharacterized damage-inducible protein DinB